MAHDVFLSYSNKDKPIADGICASLESVGIRCWIAPRDIGPGEDWPTTISNAISQSRVMVLVFSASSNSSEEVSRELFLAADNKVVIIPFKIEDVKPEAGKQYYLGRTHWLDAMNPPTRKQIQELIERVGSFITGNTPAQVIQNMGGKEPSPAIGKKGRGVFRGKPWLWAGIVVMVLLGIGIKLLWIPKVLSETPGAQTIQPNELPPTNLAGKLLFEENFTDLENEGKLPPTLMGCSGASVGIEIQRDGMLQIPPEPGMCQGVSLRNTIQIFRILPAQFQTYEVHFKFVGNTFDAQLLPGLFMYFGIVLENDANQETYNLGCGSNPDQNVWDFKCIVSFRNDQASGNAQQIYATNQAFIQPDQWYTLQIILVDPEKLQWQFRLNDIEIGEYTFPVDQAAVWNQAPLKFQVGHEAQEPASVPTIYVDHILVLGR